MLSNERMNGAGLEITVAFYLFSFEFSSYIQQPLPKDNVVPLWNNLAPQENGQNEEEGHTPMWHFEPTLSP